MESPKSILKQILTEAAEAQIQKLRLLCIFDLDSTLFDLSMRTLNIVRDFCTDQAMKSSFAREIALLQDLKIERQDWGLREPLDRLGLSAKRDPLFWNALMKFWAERFFSNHYLKHDQPVHGAVDFVHSLMKYNCDILYLTGRDIPRMHVGTLESLKQWGFPIDHDNVQLSLKPHDELDDAYFKLEVIQKLEEQYNKIWLFENEPVNLHLIQKHCPDVGLVMLETCHSGVEDPAPHWVKVPHFKV